MIAPRLAIAACLTFGLWPIAAHAEPISAVIGAISAAGTIGGAIAGVGTFAAFAINAGIGISVTVGLSHLRRPQ